MRQFKFFKKEQKNTLEAISNEVNRIVSNPTYIPAAYINTRYDALVARHVSNCMRSMIYWRGYETWINETNGYARLKISGGVNIGGMFHIYYSITRNNDTEEYRISVPLADLERG